VNPGLKGGISTPRTKTCPRGPRDLGHPECGGVEWAGLRLKSWPATFHVEHFGCRAARADGEAVSGRLRAGGLGRLRAPLAADLVIVNTCSVTAEADRAARAFIRRRTGLNPEARIGGDRLLMRSARRRSWAAWTAWPPWWATATRRWRPEIILGLGH